LPAMAQVVAEPTSRDDVVCRVAAAVGTRMKMLCGATQDLRSNHLLGFSQGCFLSCIIPHRQTAIIAAPALCDHLLPTDVFQCSHGTGPFIQLREKRMRDARDGRSPAGSSCPREARSSVAPHAGPRNLQDKS